MKFVRKSRPQVGDCRKRLKFAWLPIIATNQEKVGRPTEYWVWLENVIVYEEYKMMYDGVAPTNEWVQKEFHIKE